MKISYSEGDPGPRPRVDWGDALAIPRFYGREEEMALLSQWIVQDDCHVVSVLGMGGIGKSALSVNMMHQLVGTGQAVGTGPCACPVPTCPFEVVIFRSLRDAPSCEALLDDCLQVFSPVGTVPCACSPADLEQRISLLLEHLRKVRTLLVLDNLECLLQEGNVRGHFRPGYEGYELLLQRVVETVHRSCLLFTSREQPARLRLLESRYPLARSLRLTGLDVVACQQFFVEKAVVGSQHEQEGLIEVYAGNPLALKIVAETIVDLFGGKIGQFLASEAPVIFDGITDLLSEQFARLSALEQTVLYWLAIMREPGTLSELLALLVTPLPRRQVLLEAVDGLRRRSLIESGKRPGSFTLQSVVLEYVTATLIAEGCSEIQQHRLYKLIQYGLSQAHAKEYVRQTQRRLLVSPLLAALQSIYLSQAEMEEQLLCLLDQLRAQADFAQGYGPANLLVLLRLQRGHLRDLDLSQLSIRGTYLQNTEMQNTSLAGALMYDTVFTEAINATWAVAVSPDGRLWAAGTLQGKVRIWEEGGQTLRLIWQAHTCHVQALAFSPDGRTLGSGSADGTVKLWDVDSGAWLWTGWQKSPQSLAFSPDGSLLASAGLDATVQLWDPQSGMSLQTLTHPGGVSAVIWSPDGRMLASGCSHGEIRLCERQENAPSICVEILSVQTTWVTSLAFAPDGRTLASTHWDRTVRLWEVGSLCLLHTLPGQTNQTNRVVWSSDGRTLASSSYDKAIWLWDAEQGRCRAVLHGHTGDVYQLAFTPDSCRLLSSSADSTLRVWDVQSGQCMHVIQGYAVSLYDLDWSPDGRYLVSGGSDALVTIWDVSAETPPRELRGHAWVVHGVGWSPDGRCVASCGLDTTIRLWNPTSLSCVQRFEDSFAMLVGIAWSPDGSLLASGALLQGIQVWDPIEHSLRWIGQLHQTAFSHIVWSPDGVRLVGGGSDGNVYVWESADGTLLQRLSGHQDWVKGVGWSPDGKLLASGSGNGSSGELFVWDVQSGERVRTFAGNPGMVYAVAWSRSHGTCSRGDRLISGGSDGMLRWWDVETAECVSMRATHHETIRSLKVSPDGKSLASCGDDGAIMIWDLTSHEHVRTLRRDRPYERLNITGIRGLNEAQKATLRALGAVEGIAP